MEQAVAAAVEISPAVPRDEPVSVPKAKSEAVAASAGLPTFSGGEPILFAPLNADPPNVPNYVVAPKQKTDIFVADASTEEAPDNLPETALDDDRFVMTLSLTRGEVETTIERKLSDADWARMKDLMHELANDSKWFNQDLPETAALWITPYSKANKLTGRDLQAQLSSEESDLLVSDTCAYTQEEVHRYFTLEVRYSKDGKNQYAEIGVNDNKTTGKDVYDKIVAETGYDRMHFRFMGMGKNIMGGIATYEKTMKELGVVPGMYIQVDVSISGGMPPRHPRGGAAQPPVGDDHIAVNKQEFLMEAKVGIVGIIASIGVVDTAFLTGLSVRVNDMVTMAERNPKTAMTRSLKNLTPNDIEGALASINQTRNLTSRAKGVSRIVFKDAYGSLAQVKLQLKVVETILVSVSEFIMCQQFMTQSGLMEWGTLTTRLTKLRERMIRDEGVAIGHSRVNTPAASPAAPGAGAPAPDADTDMEEE